MKSIKEWQTYIRGWAKGKGWEEKGLEPFTCAALMHSEISEFVEDIRHGHPIDYYAFMGGGVAVWHMPDYLEGGEKPIGPAIELADLAIRLLHYCEYFGIDLEKMIEIKMKYNETRPYRHGNKTA